MYLINFFTGIYISLMIVLIPYFIIYTFISSRSDIKYHKPIDRVHVFNIVKKRILDDDNVPAVIIIIVSCLYLFMWIVYFVFKFIIY